MGDVVKFKGEFVSPRLREARSFEFNFRKGLIIGPNLKIRGKDITGNASHIGNSQLRRAILFWDSLVLPITPAFEVSPTAELEFLEEAGFLTRPVFHGGDGYVTDILIRGYEQCFRHYESLNSGSWAVAQGPDALDLGEKFFAETRGAGFDLYSAVPVPEADVPLHDVLEFKHLRRDECIAFNDAVDTFFDSWVTSHDQAHQLTLAKRRIETACADLVKVARESKKPFKLSNWQVRHSFDVMTGYGAYELVEKIPFAAELPFLSEVVGFAVSFMDLSSRLVAKKDTVGSSPYRYAVSIDQKLRGYL